MFNVLSRGNKLIVRTVYSVMEDLDSGEIMFLIYDSEQWMWVSSKNYKPINRVDDF